MTEKLDTLPEKCAAEFNKVKSAQKPIVWPFMVRTEALDPSMGSEKKSHHTNPGSNQS